MLGTVLQFAVGKHILEGDALSLLNRAVHIPDSNFQGRVVPAATNQSYCPLNRLPNEILLKVFSENVQEVFQLSATEIIDPDEDAFVGVSTTGLVDHDNRNGKAAMVLSHVSSHWRGLTLKSRNLWTIIDLDTIRPNWLLEMLYRSGNAALSFLSQVPLRRQSRAAVHVWSLAHAHFKRCQRLHIHITVDPNDVRGLGGLLALPAPRLEECSIHYIPHKRRDFALKIGQKFEAGNATLFVADAPLLHSLYLVDCHLPPYQHLFPNLTNFYTSISGLNEQSDYSQRRGLPEFMLTIPSFSRIQNLFLLEAIDHSFDPKHDLIPDIDSISLPHLREFQFAGSAYAASHLLRIFRPPARCSFFLNVDTRQWDERSPMECSSSVADLLRPISTEIDAHTWALGLDGDGVFSLHVNGLGLVYELSFSTRHWGFEIESSTLRDDELWGIHPFRLAIPPSGAHADVAYSCILRLLTSRFLPGLIAARKLQLDIPESDFAFLQTIHILEQMANLTQLTVRDCRAQSIHGLETAIATTKGKVLPHLLRVILPSHVLEDSSRVDIVSIFNRIHTPYTDANPDHDRDDGSCATVTDIEVTFLDVR